MPEADEESLKISEKSANSSRKTQGENNASEMTRSSGNEVKDDRDTGSAAGVSKSAIDSPGSKNIGRDKMADDESLRDLAGDPEVRRIVEFLRRKSISDRLIGRLLKNGPCDGFDRLLCALGVAADDLEKFTWPKRFERNDRPRDSPRKNEDGHWTNHDESSMSPDNLYLKKHFGQILTRAAVDILARKPRDPVAFLGNWLMNHKICEERENRRREFQSELNARREKPTSPVTKVASRLDDEEEKSMKNHSISDEYDEGEMRLQ